MPTTHIIEYDAIAEHLKQENERNPNRTRTSFDILLTNVDTALAHILNGNDKTSRTIAITLDSATREVTVFGTPIPDPEKPLIILEYLRDKPPQQQLYHLLTDLVDYAKRMEQYDRFFREIITDT